LVYGGEMKQHRSEVTVLPWSALDELQQPLLGNL
jgi:hypothetical protein